MTEDTSESGVAATGDPPEPTRAAEHALHARLLAGDPVAPSELAETYLPPLAAWLLRAFPHVDPHLVEDAATDAVLDTAQHPERYDPARLPLARYLRMAARGDLLNAWKSAQRRAAHHASLDAVELHGVARNPTTEDTDDPAEIVARRGNTAPGLLAAVRATFDPQEQAVVALMLDGERRTSVYARLLDLEHLTTADQAREVKRVKDRLDKRLRRLAPRVQRDG
jgi:hypothetical protein